MHTQDTLTTLLHTHGKLETFPRGHVFYTSNEEDDTLYYLTSGLCRLMSLKPNGKEHIYHYQKAPSLLGLTAATLDYYAPGSRTTNACFMIVAKTACKAYRLSRKHFFTFLADYPSLIETTFLAFAHTSSAIIKHFYITQETSASAKIAATLLSLAERQQGTLMLHKAFTYNELSKYLGIHPITVARIIAMYKDLGILTRQNGQMCIYDPLTLNRYATNALNLHY